MLPAFLFFNSVLVGYLWAGSNPQRFHLGDLEIAKPLVEIAAWRHRWIS
jgi:hypothetical protein